MPLKMEKEKGSSQTSYSGNDGHQPYASSWLHSSLLTFILCIHLLSMFLPLLLSLKSLVYLNCSRFTLEPWSAD